METTRAHQVKIVDTFNGYEGPIFEDTTEAEAALARRRRAFYRQPGNRNAYFCQAIVPATYRWQWDPWQNRFAWGEK